MAKLVKFCRDNTHPDSAVSEQFCYKDGDIVSVYEDDFPIPSGICPPLFEVVTVPGTKQSLSYLEMIDEKINVPIPLRKTPAVMAKLLSSKSRKHKRMRRYQFNDGVKQKCL